MQTQRARGLLLGLALGEAMGAASGPIPPTGRIKVGTGTQLAAFTTEGLIRSQVRMHSKGIVDVGGVLWHSLSRWAALQGIEVDDIGRRWRPGTEGAWPDGWLSEVPALTKRRGRAPATVAAVTGLMPGTLENPATQSEGWHGMIRTLPVAVVVDLMAPDSRRAEIMSYAALTHGPGEGTYAAYAAAAIASRCLAGRGVRDAVEESGLAELGTYIDMARVLSEDIPRDASTLRQHSPGSVAKSALFGGLYTALSFPERHQVMQAMSFAKQAQNGSAVGAVTGALLGAVHGADSLPAVLLSRLELTWVLDTLARDLVEQLNDGAELASDSNWWHRYPGW